MHAGAQLRGQLIRVLPERPRARWAGRWSKVQWNFTSPYGIKVEEAWQHAIDAGDPGGGRVTCRGARHRRRVQDLARKPLSARTRPRPEPIRPGHDFVRNNSLPFDRNGHGTFVAGTIAQRTNNNVGVTGVAYQSRIMPVRVLDYEGQGDVATIARGIRMRARRGAKIMNMSFEFSIGLSARQIPEVISAMRYAERKGVLMIGAAGNGEEARIAYPARARGVMAIGATTLHGCIADYSNTGSGLDMVAPGGGTDA